MEPDEGGSGFIADDVESLEMSKFNSSVVKVFFMVRNVTSLLYSVGTRGHHNSLEDRRVVTPKQKLVYYVTLRYEREKYECEDDKFLKKEQVDDRRR